MNGQRGEAGQKKNKEERDPILCPRGSFLVIDTDLADDEIKMGKNPFFPSSSLSLNTSVRGNGDSLQTNDFQLAATSSTIARPIFVDKAQ